jgi:hypothetical protein
MTLLLPRIIVLLSRQIDDGPGKPKKACRMIAPIEALSFSTGPRRKAKQFAGDFSGGCQRRSGLWPGIYATRDICRRPGFALSSPALILPGGPHLGKSERCGVAFIVSR